MAAGQAGGPDPVRGRAVRLALLVGFVAGLVALGIHPSQAVSKVEAGSWWTGQPDAGGVPAPPTVPDGGLWVQLAGTETTALSAVRATLDAGDAAPVLTLKVHQSSKESISVVACPTTDAWKPVTAGPMSQAPTGDCTKGAATGVPNADGTAMSFDLGGFDVDGVINVVLVPAPVSAVPVPPVPAVSPLPTAPAPPTVNGFDITFEAPDTSAMAVVANPPPAAPVATDDTTYTEPSAFTDTVASTFTDTGTIYAPPAAVVVAAPAPRPKAAPRAPLPAAPRGIVPVSVAVPTTRDGAQAIAAFALVALIAYAVIDGRRLVPATVAARGRATLYDWPPPSTDAPVASRREGRPPALR
ncbi:MAG TPA: hypothetical protein VHN98_13210 [Acidimicrobiales bacterium]|nr:hypothetical protein [Acidimicrobiales bacterium]